MKKKKKTILCSAQTFGYGPIANLFSVARSTGKDFTLKLVLDSDKNTFPHVNPGIFSEVIYIKNSSELNHIIRQTQPAAILSSFDPNIILAGRKNGIPSYFMDGLFWFWELNKNMGELKHFSVELLESGCQHPDLEYISTALTPHEKIFLSYFLATKSYIQFAANISERLMMVKKHADIKVVGAVIYGGENKKTTGRKHVLVTLSGEILPTVSIEQSTDYAQLILEMVNRASETYFKEYPWMVLVNPLVLNALKKRGLLRVRNKNVRVRATVAQESMHNLQKNAVVVFSPPGLTTIYECASLETPLIFLPEQSIQYKNAYRLKAYNYPVKGGFFHDIDDSEMPGDKDGLTILYRKKIPFFLENQEAIYRRVFDSCKEMQGARCRERITKAQKRAVLKMVNNFNGVQQIAEDMKALLSPL